MSRRFSENGLTKPVVVVIVIIVLLVLAGTIYLIKVRLDKLASESSSTTTFPSTDNTTNTSASPTDVPIVTPTPSFDRSKFTVRVLNGTKTAGLASTVSAKLKDLGYKVSATGNATNSAFTASVVRVKSDGSTLLDQLVKDLMPDYTASGISTLKDSDSADAEVIVGTK